MFLITQSLGQSLIPHYACDMAYTKAIKMPVLGMGFGQYLLSNNADDFVDWGCLPRSASNYGYLFGRQAGQSRETFPKIFIPGHNK